MLTLDMLPWAIVACVLVRLAFASAARARLESQLSLARDELADTRLRVGELESLAIARRDAVVAPGTAGLHELVQEIVTQLDGVERNSGVRTDVTVP